MLITEGPIQCSVGGLTRCQGAGTNSLGQTLDMLNTLKISTEYEEI